MTASNMLASKKPKVTFLRALIAVTIGSIIVVVVIVAVGLTAHSPPAGCAQPRVLGPVGGNPRARFYALGPLSQCSSSATATSTRVASSSITSTSSAQSVLASSNPQTSFTSSSFQSVTTSSSANTNPASTSITQTTTLATIASSTTLAATSAATTISHSIPPIAPSALRPGK